MATTEEEDKNNDHRTGGRGVNSPPPSDIEHDPYHLFCSSFADRSGAAGWKNTHDDKSQGPGITCHYRPGGNASGWSWGPLGEVAEFQHNASVKVVNGGNFILTNGTNCTSAGGANQGIQAEKAVLNTVLPGGPRETFSPGKSRGLQTCGNDTASALVSAGSDGKAFPHTQGIMANVVNIRGVNCFSIGSCSEGGSIGANKNLMLSSAAGAINSTAGLGIAMNAGTLMSLESTIATSIYNKGGAIILTNLVNGIALGKGGTVVNGVPFLLLNTLPMPPPIPVDVAGKGPPCVPPAPDKVISQFA